MSVCIKINQEYNSLEKKKFYHSNIHTSLREFKQYLGIIDQQKYFVNKLVSVTNMRKKYIYLNNS